MANTNIRTDCGPTYVLVHIMYLFMDPRLLEPLNKSIRPKADQGTINGDTGQAYVHLVRFVKLLYTNQSSPKGLSW
jgi:hypothetical protein